MRCLPDSGLEVFFFGGGGGWQKQAGEASEGGKVPGQLCGCEAIRRELLEESTRGHSARIFNHVMTHFVGPLTIIFFCCASSDAEGSWPQHTDAQVTSLLILAVRQSQTVNSRHGSAYNATHKVNQIRLEQPSPVTPAPVNYHDCKFRPHMLHDRRPESESRRARSTSRKTLFVPVGRNAGMTKRA